MIELSHERDDHNLDNMGSAKDLNRKAFFLVASSTCCIEATFETVFIFFLSPNVFFNSCFVRFCGTYLVVVGHVWACLCVLGQNHVLCSFVVLRVIKRAWACFGRVSPKKEHLDKKL